MANMLSLAIAQELRANAGIEEAEAKETGTP